MQTSQPKMIVIVGPTASGKSDLGLHIAKKYSGEILCADSKTIFCGLDIGSAKPSAADQAAVPHHLLDLVEPGELFTVRDFQRCANAAVFDVGSRARTPVMVGGSGLYIDSVAYGFTLLPPADPALRRELMALGHDELVERLAKVSPEALKRIDVKNPRRVIRAIETAGLSQPDRGALRAGTLMMGIGMDKEIIHDRIKKRIEKMLSQGFIEEVSRLGVQYGFDNEAMSGIGYRAFKGVIEGTKTVAAATDEFIRGDMRLVKKQLTWFRRNQDIVWLDGAALDLTDKADKLVDSFILQA